MIRFIKCEKHEWRIVPREQYTLKEKTSLAIMNPYMQLIECKNCKTRKWVYKNLNK